jgi:hypothetical protein
VDNSKRPTTNQGGIEQVVVIDQFIGTISSRYASATTGSDYNFVEMANACLNLEIIKQNLTIA